MKYSSSRVAASVVLVICADLVSAATVKTKDGRVVEGEIKELLVQKGVVKVINSEDGTKSYMADYVVTIGEKVEAIDEKGVHSTWITSVGATEQGQPPNDLEVLKPGEKTGIANPRKGGKLLVLSLDYRPRLPINEPLIGTLRRKPGTEKEEYIIVPEFTVATKDGPVTVLVSEIPPFQERSGKK